MFYLMRYGWIEIAGEEGRGDQKHIAEHMRIVYCPWHTKSTLNKLWFYDELCWWEASSRPTAAE
jgi:hypothetical protein